MKLFLKVMVLLAVFTAFGPAIAAEMRLAVTTSFNNSGLSDVLLPEIKNDTGIAVQLLVVGTGQALKLGQAGDVDAILAHSKDAEEKFISEGYGSHRREIMFNDFVLIGPKEDRAEVASANKVSQAFKAIERIKPVFVSRGDDSGTHRRELALWKSANLDVSAFDPSWYRSAGSGMGAALNTASGMNAYIMADRASWLKFGNKGDLVLLFSGDPVLFNQYAYLPINKEKHPHVKSELANKLEEWLVSKRGQELIGAYIIDGEKLFTPNAKAQ